MNTYSQGTEDWKQVTKNMTIHAYNPVSMTAGSVQCRTMAAWLPIHAYNPVSMTAGATLRVVAPGLPDSPESDWPYRRTTINTQSARLLRSLVTGGAPGRQARRAGGGD
jgi:hypothetical protein